MCIVSHTLCVLRGGFFFILHPTRPQEKLSIYAATTLFRSCSTFSENVRYLSNHPLMLTACLSWAGCKGAQVEEIWSMDPENFDNLKYVRIATELYCIAKICFFKCVYSATGQFMGWFFSSNGSQVRSLQGPSSKIQGLTTSSLLNRYFQPLYGKYVCEQYLLTWKSATKKYVALCYFSMDFGYCSLGLPHLVGYYYELQFKFSQISKQNSKFLSFYFRF